MDMARLLTPADGKGTDQQQSRVHVFGMANGGAALGKEGVNERPI